MINYFDALGGETRDHSFFGKVLVEIIIFMHEDANHVQGFGISFMGRYWIHSL
jgi:hypothetical protein